MCSGLSESGKLFCRFEASGFKCRGIALQQLQLDAAGEATPRHQHWICLCAYQYGGMS